MLFETFINCLRTVTDSRVNSRCKEPYWVIITTNQPKCIYYFGPFDEYTEAYEMRDGYIDDLIKEKAIGISIRIKRCSPTKLTVSEEDY